MNRGKLLLIAGLAMLAALFAFPQSIAAQECLEGVYDNGAGSIDLPENTWSPDSTSRLTYALSKGCTTPYRVVWQMSGVFNGAGNNQFWAPTRRTYITINSALYSSAHMVVDYACTVAGTISGAPYSNLVSGSVEVGGGSESVDVDLFVHSKAIYGNTSSFTLAIFCELDTVATPVGSFGLAPFRVTQEEGSHYTASRVTNWRWYKYVTPPPTSEYCTDGIELLPRSPISLTVSEFTGPHVYTGTLPAFYTVRHRIRPQAESGAAIYALSQINDMEFAISQRPAPPVYTTTVGVLTDREIQATFTDLGDPLFLDSMCVIAVPPPAPYGCSYLYDFTEGLSPWEKTPGGGANWDDLESDGAARILDGTLFYRLPYTDTWQIEFAARSYAAPHALTYGFDTVTATVTLAEAYGSYSISATTTTSGALFSFVAQAAYIDWVCLRVDDGGIAPLPPYTPIEWIDLPLPTCTFPAFDDHPEFTITEIGEWILWLAEKFGALIDWLSCRIVYALYSAINWLGTRVTDMANWIGTRMNDLAAWIVNQISRIFKDFPAFPGLPEFPAWNDIEGWLKWFELSWQILVNWFGIDLIGWIRDSVVNIAQWLRASGYNLVQSALSIPLWAYNLGREMVFWLIDQVAAILGITTQELVQWIVFFKNDIVLFFRMLAEEIALELGSLWVLLDTTGQVFSTLIIGTRAAFAGETTADFGENLGGMAAFLWRGVRFTSESIENTPMEAANILALGVLALGLITYSFNRFKRMFARTILMLQGTIMED